MLMKQLTIQITYYGPNGYFWSAAVYFPWQDPISLEFSIKLSKHGSQHNSMKTNTNPIKPKSSATFILTNFCRRLPIKYTICISYDGYPLHTFYYYFLKNASVCNYFPSQYTDFNVRNH